MLCLVIDSYSSLLANWNVVFGDCQLLLTASQLECCLCFSESNACVGEGEGEAHQAAYIGQVVLCGYVVLLPVDITSCCFLF